MGKLAVESLNGVFLFAKSPNPDFVKTRPCPPQVTVCKRLFEGFNQMNDSAEIRVLDK